jgi:hypothetical protein
MKFYELAVGARFFFRGRGYVKLAMSMAEDEDRVGHIFQAETELTADGEPLLLPPEEAARWKPPGGALDRAPGACAGAEVTGKS